jgi:hypothetical protein
MKKIIKGRNKKPARKTNNKKKAHEIKRKPEQIKKTKKKIDKNDNKNMEIKKGKNSEITEEQKNSLKNLIRDIYNVKEARRQIYFLGIDLKAIYDEIDQNFFEKCFNKLKEIEKVIIDDEIDHKRKKNKIFTLSKEYYEIIPHTFPLPDYEKYLISTIEDLKKEIDLLELIRSYTEMSKKYSEIKESNKKDDSNEDKENEEKITISKSFFEKGLSAIKYTITPINEEDNEFKVIKNFMNVFSNEGKGTYPPLELLELFKLGKKNDEKNIEGYFYWYGCQIPHFYSLLTEGIKLPVHSSPKNAYDYGRGIMFSNNIYNQIKNCFPKKNIIYLFVLCAHNLKSKHVHICHRNYPKCLDKIYNSVVIKENIFIPSVQEQDNNDEDEDEEKDYISSEDYVIYNPSLIDLLYIAKIQIPEIKMD